VYSLPSSDWESMHFTCSETKKVSDDTIKRRKAPSFDMVLYCSLWLEIKDNNIEGEDDELDCGCKRKYKNRLFRPDIVIKIFNGEEGEQSISSDMENCIAEKFLELGRVRPVFRFQISDLVISVIQLESFLQFGRGSQFKPVVKVEIHSESHPVNKSLVEVELETEERQGVQINFPPKRASELMEVLQANKELLPDSIRDDRFISFLRFNVEK